MIPVVTYLGQDLGALMGGAMITEQIFNIHGIGYLTIRASSKARRISWCRWSHCSRSCS